MKNLMLLSLLGICLLAVPPAQAQPVAWGFGIGVAPGYVGPPPICPYGYYPYYPYTCAPYGYYGPDWFVGGVFIGAGPWFHGYHGWRGYYGRPGYWGHGGYYGRNGYYARPGYYGHSGFRGGHMDRGPAHYSGGPAGGGFHRGYAHGGSAWSGSHGGGHRGGGRR